MFSFFRIRYREMRYWTPIIDEYQGPGDVVLRSEEHPGQTCPLSDVIKQVHVDKEEDVVTHAVPAKKIDVKRGEIPDLDDCQR